MAMNLFTLDSGLKVAINSAPQFETVGVSVGVNCGSMDENPKLNGSAHYLEHMLFKGTKRRTWKQIAEEVRNLGMTQSAFTGKENTIYYIQAYKGYFGNAVDLLSDMLTNSVFPEKEFLLERGPVINENMKRNDNSQWFFYDFLPMALYDKYPAKRSVSGDASVINKIQLKDILKLYKNYYNPGNMVVSVYGGINMEKSLDAIENAFSDFSRKSSVPKRYPCREKQELREIVIGKKGIKQARIGIGFKTKGFSDASMPEYLSLLALSEVATRRIFDSVREERGLSYDPFAYYNSNKMFGFIAASSGIKPKDQDTAKDIILKEFEKLHDGEIGKDELKSRINGLSIRYRTYKESTLGMSVSIASNYLTYGNPFLMDKLPDMIKKVTLDDVKKYAAQYIDVDKYGLVMLKPE